MLANTSQLLLRNLNALGPGRLLLINPPADDLAVELGRRQEPGKIVMFSQDYADHLDHRRHEDDYCSTNFGPWMDSDVWFDQVIIFLARERQRTRMLVAMARTIVSTEATIWLVGEKRAGIKASSRFLDEIGDVVSKLDAARHCMLFCAAKCQSLPTFSAEPWFDFIKVRVEDLEISLASLPGVFSHGELDPGTRLLLENLPLPRQGRVLDFGCGCGIIGTWIRLRCPDIDLQLTDTSALALAATRATLRVNGADTGSEVIASDVFSDIEGQFDLIVSNPPFHKGVATNYRTSELFLQQSARRLTPGGRLVIVANNFLRYSPLLKRVFGRVDILAEQSGFRIYRCSGRHHRRPRSA